ncbi:MAG: type II secretion system protein [Myxococcota bacterium]
MRGWFKRSTRAFSLIELALVMACVAIMASIVFATAGYITDAETKSTLAKVSSLKKATHAWSKRRRAGHGYALAPYPDSISVQALITEGLIPDEDPTAGRNVWTAWGTDLPPIRMQAGGPNQPGVGATQFMIYICAPTVEAAVDFERMMGDIAVSHRRYGGGGCPCSTCVFELTME